MARKIKLIIPEDKTTETIPDGNTTKANPYWGKLVFAATRGVYGEAVDGTNYQWFGLTEDDVDLDDVDNVVGEGGEVEGLHYFVELTSAQANGDVPDALPGKDKPGGGKKKWSEWGDQNGHAPLVRNGKTYIGADTLGRTLKGSEISALRAAGVTFVKAKDVPPAPDPE